MLAVLTNAIHVAVSSKQLSSYFPSLTEAEKIFLVFTLEHVILALRFIIGMLVPAIPDKVKQRLEYDKYFEQALPGAKHERHGGVAT